MARSYIKPGTGVITVNGRPVDEYFPGELMIDEVRSPFTATETNGQYDAFIRVRGGGIHGQAGAAKMSLARALVALSEDHRPALRKFDLLTRDSRMVERKKYGRAKARKRFQFSKR